MSYWSDDAMGDAPTRVSFRPPAGEQQLQYEAPMNILLAVKQGRNLVAKDTSKWSGRKKASDPYVRVQFGPNNYATDVVKATLDPMWDMEAMDLGVVMAGDQSFVRIALFDEDKLSKDDFMGQVAIPVAALHAAGMGIHHWWLPLQASTGTYLGEEVSGDILVAFEVREPTLKVAGGSESKDGEKKKKKDKSEGDLRFKMKFSVSFSSCSSDDEDPQAPPVVVVFAGEGEEADASHKEQQDEQEEVEEQEEEEPAEEEYDCGDDE